MKNRLLFGFVAFVSLFSIESGIGMGVPPPAAKVKVSAQNYGTLADFGEVIFGRPADIKEVYGWLRTCNLLEDSQLYPAYESLGLGHAIANLDRRHMRSIESHARLLNGVKVLRAKEYETLDRMRRAYIYITQHQREEQSPPQQDDAESTAKAQTCASDAEQNDAELVAKLQACSSNAEQAAVSYRYDIASILKAAGFENETIHEAAFIVLNGQDKLSIEDILDYLLDHPGATPDELIDYFIAH